MSKAMQIKQLELNVDKSGVIIFGKKKKVLELKKTIEAEKLTRKYLIKKSCGLCKGGAEVM